MFSATTSTLIRQSAPDVWRLLTSGRALSRWFAESEDLRPEGDFRFDFGDGDHFTGQVVKWQEAVTLGLRWRFWSVGPAFDVRFELAEGGDGTTEVTVTDRGARSQGEADELKAGWEDFLVRLAQHAHTGARCRYRWTESISACAFAPWPPPAMVAALGEGQWWAERFPTGQRLIPPDDERTVRIGVLHPQEPDRLTVARLVAQPHERGTRVQLTHTGFAGMPGDRQVARRRQAALLWAAALAEMESSVAPVASERLGLPGAP